LSDEQLFVSQEVPCSKDLVSWLLLQGTCTCTLQSLLYNYTSISWKFRRQGRIYINIYIHLCRTRRDNVVCIATGYWLDGPSSSLDRVKNFLFTTSSRPALGSTQLPIQWVLGDFSPGVKRPGREADHSLPASVKVKKLWIYTSTLTYDFMS
jgi:hypothetical protein